MTVLVTGASGMLGTALLTRPGAASLRVRASARRVPSGGDASVDWRAVDVVTGAGLENALDGVDVVIHAASAPRGEAEKTEIEGTRRVAEACAKAGVGHLLYVSILGVDRIPLAYYRHKFAAEGIVRAGTTPWTIVRGAQFHVLMDAFVRRLPHRPLAMAPAGWRVQPIDAGDFADALWERAAARPAGGIVEVGGPEVMSWTDLVRAWWRARGQPRRVLPVPVPGGLSRALRRGAATAPAAARGGITWGDWTTASS